METGSELRDLRLHHGLKALAIAKESGIDRSILSRIENGWLDPAIDQAVKIKSAVSLLVVERNK